MTLLTCLCGAKDGADAVHQRGLALRAQVANVLHRRVELPGKVGALVVLILRRRLVGNGIDDVGKHCSHVLGVRVLAFIVLAEQVD